MSTNPNAGGPCGITDKRQPTQLELLQELFTNVSMAINSLQDENTVDCLRTILDQISAYQVPSPAQFPTTLCDLIEQCRKTTERVRTHDLTRADLIQALTSLRTAIEEAIAQEKDREVSGLITDFLRALANNPDGVREILGQSTEGKFVLARLHNLNNLQ